MAQKIKDTLEIIRPYLQAGTMILMMVATVLGVLILQKVEEVKDIHIKLESLVTDVEVMKGNRFTSADGLEVWKEIHKLQTSVAELRLLIPQDVPPIWFRELVSTIATDVNSNGDRIDQVLQQINANASKIDSLEHNIQILHQDGG